MSYYKDLRDHVKALEDSGLLVRIKREINKDTELHPLVRLQFRGLSEEQRRAFLFENIVDSRGKKYTIPVLLGSLAGSRAIVALGMNCKPEEIAPRWENAKRHPLKPVIVSSAPVYEEVHQDDGLLEHGGLDEFPIPISTPGFDVAPYFSAPCWVSKDPETGIRNVGTYRAQLKSQTRTGIFFTSATQDMSAHWNKCRKLGIPLQAAIVIGGPPSFTYVSITKFPYGVDEFGIAGAIAGAPVEMVKCRTIDLEVPAHAEVVIEGELGTIEVEPEAPFGEAHGVMGTRENMPYFTVKCIAHRKDAIWQAMISQYPPSESTKMRQVLKEAQTYNLLKHDLAITGVRAVALNEPTSSSGFVVVQWEKPDRSQIMKALEAAGQASGIYNKVCVAVDADIDLWDADSVNWAIAFRSDPQRDCKIVQHTAGGAMDHSVEPPGEMEKRDARFTSMKKGSSLLIDATLKWPYPPISLPKKEFMESAKGIWEELGLPKLTMKHPWWGYNLGYWSEEEEEQATLAVKGEYYQTGEILAKRRKKV